MKLGYQVVCVLPVAMLACSLLPLPAAAQFSQQAKLIGTGAIGNAFQGKSVSLSSDGNTAIVGAPGDSPAVLNNGGAAWVLKRSRGEWTQQAKLVGTGAIGNADQGISVSLSGDGHTAIVGGPFDNNDAGAAWVFKRLRGAWTQQAKLVAAGTSFVFGDSVSLSGDGKTAIVGGPLDNGSAGAAWVFVRSRGMWSQQAKLVGTGVTGSFATQGSSVSLSGDGNTAIIGGFNDNNEVGAAWVFTRSHRVWIQQAKLVGTEAVRTALQGYSVSISDDGNTVIVVGPKTTVMPAPRGCSRARTGYGPSKAANWSARAWSGHFRFKVSPSRSPAMAEPPLSVGLVTTITRVLRGYSHARATYGPNKVPNLWVQVRLATQSQALPSRFPVTVILPSWVGLLTAMGRVLRGCSANNRCSPGRPEAQTVTAKVSRRWTGNTAGSTLRLPRWGSPAWTHCKMQSWHIAEDSRFSTAQPPPVFSPVLSGGLPR